MRQSIHSSSYDASGKPRGRLSLTDVRYLLDDDHEDRDGESSGGGSSRSLMNYLHLRGGKGNVKAGRSKSVSRTKSPERSASVKKAPLKKKRKQKQHNLGPADWMKKIKRPELQRRELSMKGSSKGRKKPVFHFWTKSKIKKFTEKRVAFRTKRRERKERLQNQIEGDNKAEVIHCWSRGWKTKFVKWLPSAAEQRVLDEAAAKEAAEAAKKALEEKEAAGGGDDEDGGGGEGDGGDGEGGEEGGEEAKGSAPKTAAAEEEEEDFMMGGFGGDSEGSGLF